MNLSDALRILVPSSLRPHFSRYKQSLERGTRVSRIGLGNRLTPVSRKSGYDRGLPIDRYYIEQFLERNASSIAGTVLEIGDNTYTRRFGGVSVSRSEVLHVVEGNPAATIVGNLETGQGLAPEIFSCIILTQALPFIYELRKAIATCYDALLPHGVLLATFPGISPVVRYDMDRWGDYWRLTSLSGNRLFSEVFGERNVSVETHGNVLSAVAFLHGLAAHEMRSSELDYFDPDYEVLIAVNAVKR